MDSAAPITQFVLSRLLPVLAVFREDLRQQARHWSVYAWVLVASGFAGLMLASHAGSRATTSTSYSLGKAETQFKDHLSELEHSGPAAAATGDMTTSLFAARLVSLHVLGLSTLVILLAASAVPSEAEILPEAILCRGISRWQYFLAKEAGRIAGCLAVFCLLTIGGSVIAVLRLPNDLSLAGMIGLMWRGGVFLALIAGISFAGGSLFGSPMWGAGVVWMALYGLGITVGILEIQPVSPVALSESLPQIARGAATPAGETLTRTLWIATAALNVVALVRFSRRDL